MSLMERSKCLDIQGDAYIRTEGVVVIRHDIGERVRDISAGNNLLCFPSLVSELAEYKHAW